LFEVCTCPLSTVYSAITKHFKDGLNQLRKLPFI
jgi:hypothetical protein